MSAIHWNQIQSGSGRVFTPCGAERRRNLTTAPRATRHRDEVTCAKCRDFLGMAR